LNPRHSLTKRIIEVRVSGRGFQVRVSYLLQQENLVNSPLLDRSPPYGLSEQRGIRPCLVNARHMKNVPGRRTDWHECQWLQFLQGSRTVESNTPVDSSATVVTPHCSSQSVKRSRSSVKVANTRTGFSSRAHDRRLSSQGTHCKKSA